MPDDLRDRARRAAAAVQDAVRNDPRYNRTSRLLIVADDAVLVDDRYRDPGAEHVFSVTKSVLATVLGVIAGREGLPSLEAPVSDVLAELRGTPSAGQTWRQLLTMTRGAVTDGAWEIDAVNGLPSGQVAHLARAPQVSPPGEQFGYDNGAAHLLSAAAAELVGVSVADYAERHLFAPLGIEGARWAHDPDGIAQGADGLQLSADGVAAIGRLWLGEGRHHGHELVERGFLEAMTSRQNDGGPPEDIPYGFLTWLPPGLVMAAGWAGQHLLVDRSRRLVVVVTTDAGFRPGPPPIDAMPQDWRPAVELVRPVLFG